MWRSLLGLFVLIGLAWLVSEDRRRFPWRVVISGVLLQAAIAVSMFKFPPFRAFFLALNGMVSAMEEATRAGTSFVFGYLGGADLPFAEATPGSAYILGLRALPMVVVMAALAAVLYYWRILPWVVRGFSFVLKKSMGLGGALGVGASATIFLGMVEGPLMIRPYLKSLTRSEFFGLMTCGMACIAGTMLVIYAEVLKGVVPDSMGHILTASIIHAPAALVIASVMVPESAGVTSGEEIPPSPAESTMDAVSKGTTDGLHMFVGVVGMLISIIALVKLADLGLALFPDVSGEPLTLSRILGLVMSPLAWLLGVPWEEARTAGSLLGVKVVLNEFLAYIQMAKLPEGALSPRSHLIMTYAMCGFANLGSLGILLGGMGAICPERRTEMVGLGLKSVLAGVLACCTTGALVGVLY